MEPDDDPLAMAIVVRRRTARPFPELAAAGALAARRCARRYLDDDRWRASFEEWWRSSFRKICLRAEPREWEEVRALDHERVGDVACLPPRRRSQRERVLVRMQALAGEVAGLEPPAAPAPGELLLVVNTGLPMSAGKAIAQIAHGALMVDPLEDLATRVAGTSGVGWDALAGSGAAVVRDGGLTEIPRGSETVAVWRGVPRA
ncbi:Peptidyl-tRNA hydrolase PTH2 [Gaiella occulta]|uniref:Peptidyl-tRNA hydrolase PTH2 n=1 Tax=Gaiella occulta TaxID=1002870 RepID=A0A7M2YT40_9ACTN|nr:hypothetical protein [Gaiella occulta]RDI73236.1 Peptidyl-tRNA hydrolase PTH2 [Gaiella occulta]